MYGVTGSICSTGSIWCGACMDEEQVCCYSYIILETLITAGSTGVIHSLTGRGNPDQHMYVHTNRQSSLWGANKIMIPGRQLQP